MKNAKEVNMKDRIEGKDGIPIYTDEKNEEYYLLNDLTSESPELTENKILNHFDLVIGRDKKNIPYYLVKTSDVSLELWKEYLDLVKNKPVENKKKKTAGGC